MAKKPETTTPETNNSVEALQAKIASMRIRMTMQYIKVPLVAATGLQKVPCVMPKRGKILALK